MFKCLQQGPDFYGKLRSLAVPMILQNILAASLALTDTFMVGALGEQKLAAVALANTFFFVVFLVIIGFQGGTTVLTSQYWGKQDVITIKRILSIGIIVASSFLLLVSVAMVLFPRGIMGIFTNDAELADIAAEYARIVAFSYPLSAITSITTGVLRSMGNAKIGMYIMAGAMILNVIFNYIFIFGAFGIPAMGVAGAALGTLLARLIEAFFAVFFTRRYPFLRMRVRDYFKPGRDMWKPFFKLSMPIVANEFLWGLGFSITPIILGNMQNPSASVAAYSVTSTIERIFTSTYFAVGASAAVMVGNSIGEGVPHPEIKQKAFALNIIAVGIGFGMAVILLLCKFTIMDPLIFPLFDASPETREIAHGMMWIIALFMPVRAFNFTAIVGTLRSGGDVRFVMILDVIFMYGIAIPLAAVLGLVVGAPVLLVYSVATLEEILKTCVAFPRLRTGKWIRDLTRPKE